MRQYKCRTEDMDEFDEIDETWHANSHEEAAEKYARDYQYEVDCSMEVIDIQSRITYFIWLKVVDYNNGIYKANLDMRK